LRFLRFSRNTLKDSKVDYLAILRQAEKEKEESSCSRETQSAETHVVLRTTSLMEDPQATPESLPKPDAEEAMLGAEQGVLTLDDLPELRRRLEAQGWKVVQRGSELFCTPQKGLIIQ
jgi:hypothetical protein